MLFCGTLTYGVKVTEFLMVLKKKKKKKKETFTFILIVAKAQGTLVITTSYCLLSSIVLRFENKQ